MNQGNRNRNRAKLLGLFFLFLSPWVLATLCYHRDWLSLRPKTQGVLLSEPISMSDSPLIGLENKINNKLENHLEDKPLPATSSWLWLYLQPTPCDLACENALDSLKKIQAALGKDRSRVTLLSLKRFEGSSKAALNTVPDFLTAGTLAIIDPQGWLMLYYPPEIPYKGVLMDFRRLLKYARSN